MAMNRIQFQAGLSMAAFFERYGTEALCVADRTRSDSFGWLRVIANQEVS